MAIAATRRCYCGCGRPFELCHGLPRRVRRGRKGELDGLAEIHDVSALFPSVRPRDSVLEAFAERVASVLNPAEPRVPIAVIEEGVGLLAEAESRRIVDDWADAYPDRWESVCAAVGDPSLVARGFVASAVRGAISERRPVPRELVTLFEGGKLRRSPVAALGLVLAPALVWNRDAAVLLRVKIGCPGRLLPPQLDYALAVAIGYVGDEQLERVKTVSQRLASQLPVAGLPTASATLSDGCKTTADDDAAASELATLLLVTYARAY